jgi:chorismate mutase / prephenate dehydratase
MRWGRVLGNPADVVYIPATMDLDSLRQAIDSLDDRLLELLNDRARLVGEVAALKEKMQVPFYVPSRERAIVSRLTQKNDGPFPNEGLRAVLQEVFSACLSLEKTVRVAYLGPEGTFTHMAVKRQFGMSARAIPVGTIAGVFEEVERGGADLGVVPVENSTEGVVNHTLDTFLGSDLKISAEIVLSVSHCLLGRPGQELGAIDRVYSHPQALAQCRRWLAGNLGRAALVEAPSTSEAARLAAGDARGAAVGSDLAARVYELVVMRRHISDLAENVTRFLVIGRMQAAVTGNDRTSILLELRDEPGILWRVLEPLSRLGLNMSKIESRPSKRRPWEYVFFLDVDGHQQDEKVQRAVAEVTPACTSLKVLGSYPKAVVEETK